MLTVSKKYLHEKHGTSQEIETGFQTATEGATTKRHVDAERLVRTAYMVVKEHILVCANYKNLMV